MKFWKYLFTVPEGEKVTDRALKRVLISSVCGILLCTTCLVGTTWAWYTASVETQPFSIQVAEHHVQLTDEANQELHNPVTVNAGEEVVLTAEFATDAQEDERNVDPGRYLRLEVKPVDGEEVIKLYVKTLKNSQGRWLAELKLTTDEDCIVSFYSVWQVPLDAEVLEPGTLKLIQVTDGTEEDDLGENGNADGQPGEGDQTGEAQPGEGDQTGEAQPGEGDQTGEEEPTEGENAQEQPVPEGTGEAPAATTEPNTP